MMMNSIVYTSIFCFLTLTVINIDGGSVTDLPLRRRCPINEVYNVCGSACPLNCSDLFYPRGPQFCTLQCVSGCFCKPGLYRAKDGTCVEQKECCPGLNEEYNVCGTSCPQRCDFEPVVCTNVCIQGCFCKDGFIRKDNSTNSPCISPKEC